MIEATIKGEAKELAALLVAAGERRVDLKKAADAVCEEMAESVNQILEKQPLRDGAVPENTGHPVTLTAKEAHCVARLLQSAIFGGENSNILAGCNFCKYQCWESGKGHHSHPGFHEIQEKLMKETGVDLSLAVYGVLEYSDFPYKKFLKNSNDKAQEHFRNFFNGA